MALTQNSVTDKIEIDHLGIVYVRQAKTIFEDNVEISKTYHRTVLLPGVDVSGQPENVQAICQAVWTLDVVNAYQRKQLKAAEVVEGN
jgi:hypothetical protein